ncbi:MAG: hypothetical protein UW64_C0009G0028 [Microgenomates group bacterium GW2011_GWC1_44_37]|uniref:Uncharacterized protein n=1 Tax=Candidatus Collierbacteria bacterium GW2011_GWB2_44_22 TaxID=1618387 RepID=A0A0G1HZ88_9BACT|nr:MAG: hypothetical protein UW31_C0002G0030 [Candidatus Collierbacteria bacterium GW2011_GWA2_44_13]KKT51888.1 MAG: hypothetical protein UW44_C0006G0006 [Candidatus Collierbacteria bacterium GW2011_GWB2_44_22]KKT62198.1 MAG: hypothetical protein UW56_C0010G0030 [Candidatus Collierbacteria bacterium GW2011_GWD1_44_27]KKT66189.1 MAG: hypothetical protein UW58_C0012G0031 [Candidatus Collierbacteria bacterium GW2011_GWC2_44_30]KKT68816.1 MAG: hypothetical protein UW64_C0009G0028 [Microgenomates gr
MFCSRTITCIYEVITCLSWNGSITANEYGIFLEIAPPNYHAEIGKPRFNI